MFLKTGEKQFAESARIVSKMMDKYTNKYREQTETLENINFKNENTMAENEEIQQDKGHFVMPVSEILHIGGRGYVLNGTIESGTIHVGDTVILNNGKKSLIAAIDINKELVNWATKGETITLFVGSLKKGDLDDAPEKLTVETIDNPAPDFVMNVTEQKSVKGKGVVVTGKIQSGEIHIGDPVIVIADDHGLFKSACVDEIETNGDTVSLSFKGLTARNQVDNIITTKINRE